MAKKYLRLNAEFSSIVGNPKWLEEITLDGFSSRRAESNERFYRSLIKLIGKYNRMEI